MTIYYVKYRIMYESSECLKDGNEISAERAFEAEHANGRKEYRRALVLANGLIN